MVRYLTVICAGVILVSAARGEVVFSESTIELGVLRAGNVLPYRFTVINQGTTPAEVTEVKGGCGCIKAECSPKRLQPGQEGTLNLTLNTLSATPGVQAWKVALRYQSDGRSAEATLLLHANVLQEIIVQPPSIQVTSEGSTAHEIVVTDLRKTPFRVIKVETTSSHVTAQLRDEGTDAAGRRIRKIECKVAADLPIGRHDEHILIYTDDPVYRELRVDMAIHKKGKQAFTASPEKVLLIASSSQPTPSKLVTIRPNKDRTVAIAYAEADHPALTCTWSQTPGAVGTVKVSVDRTKLDQPALATQVRVTFQDVREPPLVIPVACEIR